jgi:AcrR family transcriptional regulator
MARAQDKRKRAGIVVSAFRTFGRHGFRSATMKSIARASGVAPGSIYTYFRGKRELFKAAVDEGWRHLLSELAELRDAGGPLAERLERSIDLSFQRLRESLPLLRGMLFEASRLKAFHQNLDRFCDGTIALVDQARKEGVVRIETPEWKTLIRVLISGVLFSASIAPETATEQVLRSLKASIRSLLGAHMDRGQAS